MVEGSLADSLSRGGGDKEDAIKKLCALLLAVDRLSTVERLYCSAKLAAVHASWEEFSASGPREGGEAWLPRFITWLTSFLEQVGSGSASPSTAVPASPGASKRASESDSKPPSCAIKS
jgi:hypothetical protein